jgi:hypothetical protein
MRRVLIVLPVAVVGLCFSVAVDAKEKPGQTGHDRPMKNVITVSPTNALFTTPAEALDYLATVNPPPAADNRFLITIGPGTYSGQIEMLEWVDIEGSGRGVTTITATGSDDYLSSFTVLGADNAVLSKLTVEIAGNSTAYAHAVFCDSSAPTLQDLQIISYGARNVRGVYLDRSGAIIENVTVVASGGNSATAILSNYGTPRIKGVQLQAVDGLNNNYAMSAAFAERVISVEDSIFQAGSDSDAWSRGLTLDRCAGASLDDVEIEVASSRVDQAVVLLDTDSFEAKDCTFTARGGSASDAVFDTGGTTANMTRQITDSRLHGDRSSISIQRTNAFHIGTSMLSGPVYSYLGGTARCVASFDAEFRPLDEGCSPQPIQPPTPTPVSTWFPSPTPTPTWAPPTPTPTWTSTMTPTWTSTPTMTPTPS